MPTDINKIIDKAFTDSAGIDNIVSTIYGDTINGNGGNDTLIGGLGKDSLTGGPGKDTFKFNAKTETGISVDSNDIIVDSRDTINDFKHSEGDKIDLSAIDANMAVAGDNAFSKLTVSGVFSGVFANPGELYFDQTNHILYGNNNADKAADFSILLTDVTSLAVADFAM